MKVLTSWKAKPPGLRPKITVDFTTDWTLVSFDPEAEVMTNSGTITRPELVAKDDVTGQLVTISIDTDSPQKKQIDEIIARQEKAYKEAHTPVESPGTVVRPY